MLPTDFSDNSWNAIVYALKLYKDETCTFFFMHVNQIPVSIMSSMNSDLIETLEEKPKKELEELIEQAKLIDSVSNHKFVSVLRTEDLVTAIKNVVFESSIDIIVMGTKGATGALDVFFGTNAMQVIDSKGVCPVLLVPDNYDFTVPKEIAFPTDFNRFFREDEILELKKITELYNSKIRVLHICIEKQLSDVQDFNKDELSRLLDNSEYSFHWMPNYAKKAIAVSEFVEELGLDLLVMISYKHGILESLLNEPVIRKIGFSTKVPFLVIPEKKRKQ